MDNSLLVIIVLLAAILLYCWCNDESDVKKNHESFTVGNKNYTNIVCNNKNGENDNNSIGSLNDDSETYVESNGDYTVESIHDGDPSDVLVLDKMPEEAKKAIRAKYNTRNHNNSERRKVLNYADGVRGGDQEIAMEYIQESNDLMDPTPGSDLTDIGSGDNENYVGMDEMGNDQYAPYRPEGKKGDKYKTSEIFNSKYYLPTQKSVNNDWFEVIPEAISVKNRHLINVSKPIGINTIGTSLRNASWDIRGSPQNPKFVISPWLQSTIEPDTNIKSLC